MGFYEREVTIDRGGQAYTMTELRGGRIAMTVIAGIVGFVLLVSLVAAWPFQKVARDKMCLSYGGGVVEGAHFQGIHQPGKGLFFNGWGDRFYCYPVTQRNYIVSLHPGEGDRDEADSIRAVTSDNVRVDYEVFVSFRLNTDDLQHFHESLGLKYHAWSGGGWDDLLNDTLRQQLENSVVRATRDYDAKRLRSDTGALENVQRQVGTELNHRIIEVLGGNYFCQSDWFTGQECDDMDVTLKSVTVPGEIAEAFERNARSLIDVQTKENEIAQREKEAEAIRALNDALTEAGDQYVMLKAIESGKVTFWVLPDGQSIVAPGPTG